jgi:hypothetical protein
VIVEFYDRQDETNPRNGTGITSGHELLKALDEVRLREPSLCELMGENGMMLTVGVSADVGCAQYGSQDREPPYLMARNEDASVLFESFDFFIADTATEIDARYCLPYRLIERIALDFLRDGTMSREISWESI